MNRWTRPVKAERAEVPGLEGYWQALSLRAYLPAVPWHRGTNGRIREDKSDLVRLLL